MRLAEKLIDQVVRSNLSEAGIADQFHKAAASALKKHKAKAAAKSDFQITYHLGSKDTDKKATSALLKDLKAVGQKFKGDIEGIYLDSDDGSYAVNVDFE